MSTASERGALVRDPGSFVLRRVLPLTVATVVATAGLRWIATDRGLIPEAAGVILMTGLAVAICTGYSLWLARTLRDTTARQRHDERAELYRLVASNIPDGAVFLFDRDLRYVLAEGSNFEEVELRSTDLEGRTIWEALEPEAAAAVEPSYRAALAGESSSFEMEFRDNVYQVTVAPTFDDDGDIVGGLVHSQQITERKQLEEQLHQSQKLEAVGSLAGGVAHDFNNLLTVISGHTSMLLGRAAEPGPNRESLKEIALAADRAAGLTQQLLAFSRRQLLRPQVLDVKEVVDGVVPMLRALVEERIEIVAETPGALPKVMFDRGRLEQVIVNLVVNARDSIADDGRIVIETGERMLDTDYVAAHTDARLGLHVMLAVSDTGSGIDNETLERVFEPFFTTKAVGEGTGLGLSTVHGIVKQSGGNIWVYSEPGRGTTFRVYIPVATESAIDAHLAEDLPAHTLRPADGETILLVEDHEGVLVLTQRVLEAAGYKVVTATTVDGAAEVIARHEIDVVLTDLVMPGGTGERIAEATDARGMRPPVIYMSGYTEATATRDGLLLSGAAFLEKPFTPSGLLSAVAGVLSS
jgi:two-component system, cell cycle sensor histidine kinase and response regulator CckA